MIDKYSWVDLGSSYLPSDIQAAYLYGQLENAEQMNNERLASWHYYQENLQGLADNNKIELTRIPSDCIHNGHMFYIKLKDINERTKLIEHLKSHGVMAVFHYIPLHSAMAGETFGRLDGNDRYTTKESEKLLRLPMYFGLHKTDIKTVTNTISAFYP
jgi:dTDP-4-amino-4,6-dideoxygalactose transaminase